MRILTGKYYIGPGTAAGCEGVRGVGDQGLLGLVLVAVEVVEQVPGCGQAQLARTHGAHLVVGKGARAQFVHHGVQLDQLLQLGLDKKCKH